MRSRTRRSLITVITLYGWWSIGAPIVLMAFRGGQFLHERGMAGLTQVIGAMITGVVALIVANRLRRKQRAVDAKNNGFNGGRFSSWHEEP